MVWVLGKLAAPVSRNVPPLSSMPAVAPHRPLPPEPVNTPLLLFNTTRLPGRMMTELLFCPVLALYSEPVAPWMLKVAPFITSTTPEPNGVDPPGAPPVSMFNVLPLLMIVPPE